MVTWASRRPHARFAVHEGLQLLYSAQTLHAGVVVVLPEGVVLVAVAAVEVEDGQIPHKLLQFWRHLSPAALCTVQNIADWIVQKNLSGTPLHVVVVVVVVVVLVVVVVGRHGWAQRGTDASNFAYASYTRCDCVLATKVVASSTAVVLRLHLPFC